ncbi:MAG TPA: hypoxanthine phosphoribosyltransferase [Pseudobdellovibrionaceae bacterium]|nr:hypoxanthine phosphoribosyltransferase [Pseudobdellovibrionaceae bacterium]
MSFMELSPYITEEKIQAKVKEMGAVLTQKLQGKSVVAVCVLKGSFMFYSDLIRNIDADVTCDFFGVSSYHGGTTSSGEVRTTLDLSTRLEGRHVLLVEDIVDTGLSMNYLINAIKARKPASLTTVSLLEKPDAIKVPCEVDLVGFKIPNDFVVGYGLDYQGMYRNLPYIAQVQNFQ